MNISTILLQAAQPSTGGQTISTFVMLGLVVVVFYFFMMRPQIKKQKEQKNFINELKKGDKVVTIGGIVGKITEMNEADFVMETEGGTKLRMLRVAISLENTKAQNAPAKS